MRSIVFVGIIISSLGLSLCFFAENVDQINFLIGIVFGSGVALSYMQTPVILAQYFDKYLATATALSHAGGTVGSFIFPMIIEQFIHSYGLRGCFLVIGALQLNGLPCAILLRPPNETSNKSRKYKTKLNQDPLLTDSHSLRQVYHKVYKNKSNEKWISLRKSSIDLFQDKLNSQDDFTKMKDTYLSENNKANLKQAKKMMEDFYRIERILIESDNAQRDSVSTTDACDLINGENGNSSVTSYYFDSRRESSIRRWATKNKYTQTDPVSKRTHFVKMIIKTVTNPMYIILLITHVIFQWA